MIKYYPGEPVIIHIQSLINIIQYNNRVIPTQKSKSKLPLCCGIVEQVIPVYGSHRMYKYYSRLGFSQSNTMKKGGGITINIQQCTSFHQNLSAC